MPGRAGRGWRAKSVTAYVIFESRRVAGWWDIFTRPGWRHVWVILPAPWPAPGLLATEFTMKVEPLCWGIDVAVFWDEPGVVAQAFADDCATAVLAVDVRLPPGKIGEYIPRGVFSCVTIVKAVLGLRAWRIFTPWSLYRYLLAHRGARLVLPHDGGTTGEDNRGDLRRRGGEATGAGPGDVGGPASPGRPA